MFGTLTAGAGSSAQGGAAGPSGAGGSSSAGNSFGAVNFGSSSTNDTIIKVAVVAAVVLWLIKRK